MEQRLRHPDGPVQRRELIDVAGFDVNPMTSASTGHPSARRPAPLLSTLEQQRSHAGGGHRRESTNLQNSSRAAR